MGDRTIPCNRDGENEMKNYCLRQVDCKYPACYSALKKICNEKFDWKMVSKVVL